MQRHFSSFEGQRGLPPGMVEMRKFTGIIQWLESNVSGKAFPKLPWGGRWGKGRFDSHSGDLASKNREHGYIDEQNLLHAVSSYPFTFRWRSADSSINRGVSAGLRTGLADWCSFHRAPQLTCPVEAFKNSLGVPSPMASVP